MKTKRYLSLLLVFVLIFSSTLSMASGDSRVKNIENILKDRQEVNMKPGLPQKLELIPTKTYDENQNVRVIVQLKDKPAIEYIKGIQKYTDISETKRASLENDVLNSQKSVENDLLSKGIRFKIENRMTVAANAFSTIVKGSEIEKIKANKNVENVFISNEYKRPEKPQMATSHDMIGSKYTWDIGYKGEGMLVAIVDTGIDPSHQDMNISDGVVVKLNESSLVDKKLPGTYRTKKVPYGYNYFDKNLIILDTDINSHGMHVAGTVGANGQIKGVAPEAQLLAMKVFSRDPDFPSTYDDIYMKAIDDAIKLGVDVVNMSLGSTASFYEPNSAIDDMITNARENGVIFSISAGNSAHSTDGATHGYPSINNPDIGLVGAPSLNKDSISVASIENTHMQSNYILYGEAKKAPYSKSGPHALAGEFTNIEFVDAGLGQVSDFVGKDLNGKVALISRGAIGFTDKIMNAQNAGAAIAIVYNNQGNELINMQYPDGQGTIPAAFIGQTYGEAIKALTTKTISFPKDMISVANPNAWKMSDFTSWGTTPTLDMKPEITAPGGQIYSTLESNNYGIMSGTSMAAPHLTGGAALVEQYVRDKHKNIVIAKKISEFSKTLLMNTATPIVDPSGNFYSPRRQGAGLMNLEGAITTGVTVVNSDDGEAKVQLRELDEKKFNINLLATNHSDEELTYNIEVDVLAEAILLAGYNISFLDVEPLIGAEITGNNPVTLAGGETKNISVSVDFTNAIVPGDEPTPIRDNMFIEGFVRLVAPTEQTVDGVEIEKYPSLVVPYVGFYGDWYGEDSPRVLDGMEYFGEDSYFGYAGIVNQDLSYMGFDPINEYVNSLEKLSISPGSEDGANTEINAVLSFMRNAEEVKTIITDEFGRQIRVINTENWVRKNYSNPEGIWYSYTPDRAWDGKVNNEVVEDGKYFYEIQAKPQNGDYQVYRYPVSVDTIAPNILNLKYEEKKLTWEASDENLSHFVLSLDDEKEILAPNGKGTYELEIEVAENVKITIEAVDYAGNVSSESLKQVPGPKPTIKFETPEPFALYNKNTINIKGKVSSQEGVKSLVAHMEKDGTLLAPVAIPFDKDGNFDKEVKDLVDAVYTIKLVATDIWDQEYEIFRYFHVDTIAPQVSPVEVNVGRDEDNSNKVMAGGGNTIILPGLREAYHRNYLQNNSKAMSNFNKHKLDESKEIYVKLAEGVYVDKKGELVVKSITALKYYNQDGLVEKYDADGKYSPQSINTYKLTMNVSENHGYFKVYVNGSQEYIQDKAGVTERIPFNGKVEFTVKSVEVLTNLVIKVVDQAGNETIINRDIK